ncbi:hypothetical protein [Actinomyces bowdenii]|uniref:Uncharacterized protein n=1 Tax=Actinomyces bowdenii TaxID=131109 RepID=A0A3P1V554_9ACTO|nr:hypothetical protein [Actinomyces bowdenii]RRD29289.1 hypothetical protein EII10_07215 [Actinomyces bowdenii]
MLVALYVGPDVVARNSVAFTGTTLITPFVSALFLARGSEHALLSKILMFPRVMLLLSSISTITAGIFLSVLPDSRTSNGDEYITHAALHLLHVSIVLSTFCLFTFLGVMVRTGIVGSLSRFTERSMEKVMRGFEDYDKAINRQRRRYIGIVVVLLLILLLFIGWISIFHIIILPNLQDEWILSRKLIRLFVLGGMIDDDGVSASLLG